MKKLTGMQCDSATQNQNQSQATFVVMNKDKKVTARIIAVFEDVEATKEFSTKKKYSVQIAEEGK